MSMINISGIPNMGFAGGGGGYFGGNAALGLPAVGAVGDFGASKSSQPLYDNIFNNFGQQTDYYSGLGAAYGRATGGFGAPGSNPGWQDPGAGGGGYGFDNSAYLSAIQSMMGSWGGAPMGSLFDQSAKSGSLGSMSPFGGYAPGMQPGAMDFSQPWGGRITPQPPPVAQPVEDVNSWFNQLYGGGGGGGNAYALGGYGGFDPFGGGGGQPAIPPGFHMDTRFGVPGGMPSSQALLGYDPSFSAQFAPQQGYNPFAAFANFPNSATPSQYTYQPYTNTQGQTFQPNMPQGFAPLYGIDNPEGALPGPQSYFRNQSDGGVQSFSA